MYETKCVDVFDWKKQKPQYIQEGGWEYIEEKLVVYLRKYVRGDKNLDSKGWTNVE